MSKMNGVMRKKLYQLLVSRDGEYCRCCGALQYECQLVVDHKDNDNSNNDPENLQLLCRKCNYLKNPRRPVDECVSEKEIPDRPSELRTSLVNKPKFKQFVYHELGEKAQVPEKEVLNSTSEILDISQVTGKRYLDGMCSDAGLLERRTIGKTVVVQYKPEMPLI